MIDWRQDPNYLHFAEAVLGVKFQPGTATWLTSLSKSGIVLGVVVFSRFSDGNCEVSVASQDRRFLTRELAMAVAGYVWLQCQCRRVTAIIAVGNEKSLNLAQRLGFQEEGLLKNWYASGDAKILGLLREDCTWFKVLNGQPFSAARSGPSSDSERTGNCEH